MPDSPTTRVRGIYFRYDVIGGAFTVAIIHPGGALTLTPDVLCFLSRCIRKGLMQIAEKPNTYYYHPDPKSPENTWLLRAHEYTAVELELQGGPEDPRGDVVLSWKRLTTPGFGTLTFYPVVMQDGHSTDRMFRSAAPNMDYYYEHVDGLWHLTRVSRGKIAPVYSGPNNLMPMMAEDLMHLVAMTEEHLQVDIVFDKTWRWMLDVKTREWVLTAR